MTRKYITLPLFSIVIFSLISTLGCASLFSKFYWVEYPLHIPVKEKLNYVIAQDLVIKRESNYGFFLVLHVTSDEQIDSVFDYFRKSDPNIIAQVKIFDQYNKLILSTDNKAKLNSYDPTEMYVELQRITLKKSIYRVKITLESNNPYPFQNLKTGFLITTGLQPK